MSQRPFRPTLKDFAGRDFSLSAHEENWEELPGCAAASPDILVLGIGPGDASALGFAKKCRDSGGTIFWLEHAPTLEKLATFPGFKHPSCINGWVEVQNPAQAADAKIFFYRPGLRAAPEYWGAILAALHLKPYKQKFRKDHKKIWLPGNSSQLLHQELILACRKLGYETDCRIPASPMALPEEWSGNAPHAAISINFRGLDAEGRIFHILEEAGIPLSVWLVDNPWNLLAGIKAPWWRETRLYVTDASFIEDLKRNGAAHARHLPLAAAQHMWSSGSGTDTPLFVGRSVFPAKDAFFKGVRLPQNLREKANVAFAKGEMPDFHWWTRQCRTALWPGTAERVAALGADDFSAMNRARWLRAALPSRLRIIGDAGWRQHLPDVNILPPVDYYGVLRDLYGQASSVLNVTSLLLPASLSQRHFDVWAAGGLLLSDNTRGLEIFPRELTAPIILNKARDFMEKMDYFQAKPAERSELICQWRELILGHHLYEHRVAELLAFR